MKENVEIFFSQGTLLVKGPDESIAPIYKYLKFDKRIGHYRAQAYNYAPIILGLHKEKIPFEDKAKNFKPLDLTLDDAFEPMKHQKDAIEKWFDGDCRGVVVMPTGSGKTYFAVMAMERIKRPTLIVVPTIDLMQQWATSLERFFKTEIGLFGGGSKVVRDITVTTYDSAVMKMEFFGDQFGLAIFDECHHLPGPVNRTAASMCLAPYRLGLTATPELEIDGEMLLYKLIGPLAYQIHIDELEGKVLAPYCATKINLALDPDEEEAYHLNRKIYTDFLRSNGIYFTSKNDWNRFLALCARMPNGRKVFEAFLTQKRIARSGRSKFRKVWELINKHRGERIIVFTAENDTAYEMGKKFFLPVLTHRTKVAERKEFLDKFRNGEYPALLTSKVLNEGVDVPEASVGIIVSGSGSVREHVQRLGRILRAQDGKQAILYELISEGTSEVNVSKRRGEHRAYKNKNWSSRKRKQ